MNNFLAVIFALISTTSFAKNSTRKIASDDSSCLKEAQLLGAKHVEQMRERFGNTLNADDLTALKEDAALMERILTRTCLLIETRKGQ